MITAIDTNVLIDLFAADPRFGTSSKALLERCSAEGSLVACEIVWAEVSSVFPSREQAEAAIDQLRIRFTPMDRDAALRAGEAWALYRRRGERTRVVADFLIGAHALAGADRLVTRDRGFYRAYFAGLDVADPTV